MPQKYTYLDSMPQHRFVERHLVTLAITELEKDGWIVTQFEDEEHEFTEVNDAGDAWTAFDAVDMGWLHFDKDSGTDSAWILLIGGNGQDVISDCTINISDTLERVFLY